MRFVYPTGQDATLTDAQVVALRNIAERWNLCDTVQVQPMFGGDGAIVLDVGSMWLAVEQDGYTHS